MGTETEARRTGEAEKIAVAPGLHRTALGVAMKEENKLRIRNSTAEFLIFIRQAGEGGIEVRRIEQGSFT
ncbi:MAG: hypothetical protein AB2L14_28960 [Candidatus Xenobiia bacterium LiM19]